MGEPVLWGGILLGAFCVLLLFRKAAKQGHPKAREALKVLGESED